MICDRHYEAAAILHECFDWHPHMIAVALSISLAHVHDIIEERRAAAAAEMHARFLASLPPERRTRIIVDPERFRRIDGDILRAA